MQLQGTIQTKLDPHPMLPLDTLSIARRLEKAGGFSKKHAEAIAEEIYQVQQFNFDRLVTKEDLKLQLGILKRDLLIGNGAMIAGIITLFKLLEAFF